MNPTKKKMPEKKINIVITGVARGLGKILTEFLSQRNCQIFGTVRNLTNLEDTDNVKFFYMDLQDKASIAKAAEQILERACRIDAIIHNAGIAYLDPCDVIDDKERRDLFDVNFFGPIFLTEKLLPSFRTEKKGKIIFISSIASVDTWPGLGIYSASKAALERVAFEWAVLLKTWNIDVCVIRPNPLPTNMQILRSSRASSSPYGMYFCGELLWEKTEYVCELILKILRSSSIRFEYTTGDFSKKVVNSIIKKEALQTLIKKYRENLGLINPSCDL